MEKTTAFILFTFLLFAVSTARNSLDSPANYLPVVQSTNDASNSIIKALPEPANVAEHSNIILPTDNLKSNDDETNHVDKSRTFRSDLTPRFDFARFHAINRHFYDEPRIPVRYVHRRPYRHFVNPFMIPRYSEISHGKEGIVSGEAGSEHLHRQAPLKRLKAKHDYGHRHHRNQHHHLHHGNNDGKHMFSREKMKSLVRQHKEKKREEEVGFMKSIRKFLKHTFD